MPRYQATPPPLQASGPGPLGTLGNFAMNKGLSYGLNAALPGGGFAAEAAQEVLPGMMPYFNEGGQAQESNWDKLMRQWGELNTAMEQSKIGERVDTINEALQTKAGQQQVQKAMLPHILKAGMFNSGGLAGPLGGGQTMAALKEARALGALTQAEYLKAMAHAGYKNDGGAIHGPKHPEAKKYEMDHKHHLSSVAQYKEMGGKIGPLAKTVMKDKDGNSTERAYHNPLAGGTTSKEK